MRPGTVEHALALMEQLAQKNAGLERARREPIAIVGIGCRFPGGARDPESFWRLLEEGRDAVVPLDRRWERLGVAPPDAPRWAGLLAEEEVERFDAAFFEISDREARSLDPQQRLVLTVAWEALENAGVAPRGLAGSAVGVFVGSTGCEYVRFGERLPPEQRDAYLTTGAMVSAMAGRLSYVLGLQGPAVTLDTACSSSLVATHLACQSLRAQECGLALAGGVNLILSPEVMGGIALTRSLSPDGRCRTFDAGANGFVRGEGCGLVVLKRLSDAQRDGDRIWAVIRGSAVNQDGRSTGLTAPNVLAQQRLLRDALAAARVDAAQVDYVETHGTGTALGDPIELEALAAVLGAARADGSRCVLGALKTAIGHLEAAAGVAGMIKAALALQHRAVPANLHFEKLNPLIRLEGTPLAVAASATPLPWAGRPLLAGVSAFGISGTNAHVVLEESPRALEADQPAPRHAVPLVLSARTPEALEAQAARLKAHLERHQEVSLLDAAHTLAVARSHFEERAVVVRRDRGGAVGALAEVGRRRSTVRSAQDVAVVFPAEAGAAAAGAQALYEGFEAFRTQVDALGMLVGETVAQVLAAAEGPARFALDVALFRLCESWGLRAGAVLGSGAGEIAAAHVSGALAVEEAAKVAAARGRAVKVERVTAPVLRMISSVTAGRATAESLADPEHWVRLGRVPGRMAEGRKALEAEGFPLALELGPGAADPDALAGALASLHARGAEIDWAAFFRRLGGRRVELPTYPFQEKRHWFPAPRASAPAPRASAGGAVLAERFSAAAPGSAIWSGVLDAAAHPWLAEHRVEGQPIFPAAATLGLMRDAFARESGPGAVEIQDASLGLPLLADAGREVQVSVRRDGVVTLHSREPGGTAWAHHATAQLHRLAGHGEPRRAEDLRSELEAMPEAMDGAALYRRLRDRRDEWGPAFQAVTRLGHDGARCVAQLHATAAIKAGGLSAQAALVEAGAQAMSVLAQARTLEVPFVADGFQRCRWYAEPRGEAFWSRIRLRAADGPTLVGDLEIHDERGQLLVEIERLSLRPVGSDLDQDPRSWTYERRWERSEDVAPAPALRGHWLFLGAEAELRRALAATCGPEARLTFADRCEEPAAVEALRDAGLQGAVAIAPPGDGTPEVDQAVSAMRAALAPLRALRAPAKLWWVTRGRWSVEGDAPPAGPVWHSALWGLGSSVSVEHGATWGGLIDLAASAPAPELARSIVRFLARDPGERRVALRGDRTYLARLAPLPRPDTEPPGLSPSGAYLVTGGLGALGLAVAEWLVGCGARHLILLGRTGLPERRRWRDLGPGDADHGAISAVRALEERGADVAVAAVDVSDGDALSRWLEAYRAELRPPIRGVIHAAGVVEPGAAAELDEDRLRWHLRSKLGGALALERALAGQELDFFVLFSSAAAWVGSPQLGAYAAANACLDAFAERRRAEGRPALSIAWGPWQERGMGLRASSDQGRLFQAVRPMLDRLALGRMAALWSGPPSAAVMPIDWERWRTSYRVLLEDPFYAAFAGARPPPAPAPAPAPAGPASEQDVIALLAANLQELLGRSDPIDPDESLLVMGIDSLMAYDAQHFIEQRWSVEVPVLKFMGGATLTEIAGFIRDATGKLAPGPAVDR